MKQTRLLGLDVFRGWAILLMVLFHLSYDLNYFGFIHINLRTDMFWIYARYLIVSMFLITVGISLFLTHYPKIKWDKLRKRTFYLAFASLLISVGSYIQFPNTWIYFGILHFILLASWVGLIFLPFPKITMITFVFILGGSYGGWLHSHILFSFFQPLLHLPEKYTEDLVIFFPWFSVVLLGIILAQNTYIEPFFQHNFFHHKNRVHVLFSFMGRHSLIIYLIHQPILFTLLTVIKFYY